MYFDCLEIISKRTVAGTRRQREVVQKGRECRAQRAPVRARGDGERGQVVQGIRDVSRVLGFLQEVAQSTFGSLKEAENFRERYTYQSNEETAPGLRKIRNAEQNPTSGTLTKSWFVANSSSIMWEASKMTVGIERWRMCGTVDRRSQKPSRSVKNTRPNCALSGSAAQL